MRGVNKVTLIGNLGKDPELRRTQSGSPVASFSLATNFKRKQADGTEDDVEWHNIVAWGKLAEIVGEYLKKGSPVYIEGRIQTRNYEDQSGTTKYITEIVAQELVMLGDGPGGESGAGASGAPPPPDEPSNAADDDGLPF